MSVTDELFEKQEDCPVELDENDDTYDECFELLSNYRRRCTPHYLEQHEETVSHRTQKNRIARDPSPPAITRVLLRRGPG